MNTGMRGLRSPITTPTKTKKKPKKPIVKPLDPNKPGVSVGSGVRSIKQGYQRRKDILDQL